MSIAVLCPSRGNPGALFEAAFSCTSNAMDEETRFIPVVDEDDPLIERYFAFNEDTSLPIMVVPRDQVGNMNLAMNYAALKVADDYDIVGFVGDDHRFRTQGWDRVIGKVLADEGGGFAYGDDRAQHEALPTQVFITSPIIKALGWMGLPGARHLYLDNTWRMLGERADCLLYLPDIVIEHLHPAHNPDIPWDDNHRRVNTGEMYDHDRRVYEAWLADGAEEDIAKVKAAIG